LNPRGFSARVFRSSSCLRLIRCDIRAIIVAEK
jgi:hypothetical protein